MIYTDGTIAINAGSPIVTGTGTQWKKNIHGVAPGQLISIENGTAPVSMMIRAVNSDTELVLSFNAPVTLSGAKYSIATTVPDTISDAARTMSANQGYIVYFLQAMQQWMTDTGQVEIELPNGQKVTLDSIKALNDAIGKIPKVVQEPGDSKTDVMSQDGTVKAINAAKPGDATTAIKGIVQLTEKIGDSETLVPHQKAVRDGINALNSSIGKGLSINDNGYTEIYPSDKNKAGLWQRINTSVFEVFSGSTGKFSVANDSVKIGGTIDVKTNTPGNDQSRVEITSPDGRFSIGMWGYNDGRTLVSCRNTSGWSNVSFANVGSGSAAVIGGNIYVDGSGYIKKSSPIIQIYPDGNYDTNDESEGAEVRRTGNGQYHITGILGYNSDGAWGVNGGISVPKDNNGLELVYVDDRVQEDGSLIIETCHRQHAHLPERFQNWRLKDVTPEGERIFYQDGEPCDLPESTRLDVRVEMPQGSVWNVKQRELAEQMEREQVEREAQEAAEQGADTEE
ncbi:phage tail fiber protein [Morganella morganii]|uniref:phage tail fiber protein n=1 Tax=Morganella morganii TaxID=582 RepID=UPI002023A631|nr:hypothetical protein [Morganella morganii]